MAKKKDTHAHTEHYYVSIKDPTKEQTYNNKGEPEKDTELYEQVMTDIRMYRKTTQKLGAFYLVHLFATAQTDLDNLAEQIDKNEALDVMRESLRSNVKRLLGKQDRLDEALQEAEVAFTEACIDLETAGEVKPTQKQKLEAAVRKAEKQYEQIRKKHPTTAIQDAEEQVQKAKATYAKTKTKDDLEALRNAETRLRGIKKRTEEEARRIEALRQNGKILTVKETERAYIHGYLMPEWKPFIAESITSTTRGILHRIMGSKDPEITNLPREYLAANGVRGTPEFKEIGIEIKNTEYRPTEDGFGILTEIRKGQPIELRFYRKRRKGKKMKMDPHKFFILKKLGFIPNQNGERKADWKPGTCFLTTDRQGKRLAIRLTYTRPNKQRNLNPDRTMRVDFHEDLYNKDKYMCMHMESGFLPTDNVSYLASLDQVKNTTWSSKTMYEDMRGLNQQKLEIEQLWRNKSTNRHVRERLSKRKQNLQKRQTGTQRRWRGTINQTIRKQAERWNCGKIIMGHLPDKFYGFPWPQSNFKLALTSKLKEYGIQITWIDDVKVGKTKTKRKKEPVCL